MSMSVGFSTSSMPVIELTVVAPSLIESAAMWTCASMMPGVTNLPLRLDDLRAAGACEVGADRVDLAVAKQDRAVLESCPSSP